MVKRLIFATWDDWRSYSEKAVRSVVMGVLRVIFALVMGLVSLGFAIYKRIAGFVKRHVVFSLLVLLFVVIVCWVFTFVKMSVNSKAYEVQRDSLSYELMKVQSALNGDTLVISTTRLKQNYQNHWQDKE